MQNAFLIGCELKVLSSSICSADFAAALHVSIVVNPVIDCDVVPTAVNISKTKVIMVANPVVFLRILPVGQAMPFSSVSL